MLRKGRYLEVSPETCRCSRSRWVTILHKVMTNSFSSLMVISLVLPGINYNDLEHSGDRNQQFLGRGSCLSLLISIWNSPQKYTGNSLDAHCLAKKKHNAAFSSCFTFMKVNCSLILNPWGSIIPYDSVWRTENNNQSNAKWKQLSWPLKRRIQE